MACALMCVGMCVVVQLVRESQRHCAVLVFELICIGELGSQGEKRKKDILATFPHEYTVLCPSSIFLQNHMQTLYGIGSSLKYGPRLPMGPIWSICFASPNFF